MAFKDNREFIRALEKTRDVVRVTKEVDWDYEAGAINRRLSETHGPAVLFENVKDYPGKRLFAGALSSWRRMAVALGLPVDTPVPEILDAWDTRIKRPIKPVIVNKAPCQENILTDSGVNLFDFPVPLIHEGDGGRYMLTWHIIVSRDPDSEWVNWGMYRGQLVTERYLAGLVHPISDLGRVFHGKYAKYNKPMPIAIAIGADPITTLTGGTPFGPIDEADMAGALRLEPVELVKCKTVDLHVPAHAEIILEGEILPDVLAEEGPFGEYTGYRVSERAPRLIFKINTLTYRNEPVLTMSNMGMPIDECDITWSCALRGIVKARLEEFGIPVKQVYAPPELAMNCIVVSTEVRNYGLANQIGNIVFSISSIALYCSHVIVVEEDVDIFNLNEVFHTLMTRCNPEKDIITKPLSMSSPLIPFMDPDDRRLGRGVKTVFDCTWPVKWSTMHERPRKSSFNMIYPEFIQKRVLRNWKAYGF
ncbi:MAG: UbiD family decarboxylase [Acidobacteria bacterium]|nr:UbiD family decarboxylase [Acidobacteriota bacterium]